MNLGKWLRPFRKLTFGDLDEAKQARLRRDYELYQEEMEMADDKDTQTQVETQQEAQVQEVAVAEVPVADPVTDKPKAEQTQQEVAKDKPVQVDRPVQQRVAETVLVEEEDDAFDDVAFDDIYAAATMAFANSRATKSQRERELEMLEDELPVAQAALVSLRKEGQDLVAAANQRSSQMVADGEAEVQRIEAAITAKTSQIAKAETSGFDKAKALIAVLKNYVGIIG